MHEGHEIIRTAVSRRTFLAASGLGFCGLSLPDLATAAPAAPGRARSTILIWLSGGASHIDTWDLKPNAPAEYPRRVPAHRHLRPRRAPVRTPAAPGPAGAPPGRRQLAGRYGRGTGDHHAGYYYNFTGHSPTRHSANCSMTASRCRPTGRSSAPSWPPSARRTPTCRRCCTLPQKPGAPQYTRPGQFAARLGIEYDPVYLLGTLDRPTRVRRPGPDPRRRRAAAAPVADRRSLLASSTAPNAPSTAAPPRLGRSSSAGVLAVDAPPQTKGAFNLRAEPQAVRRPLGPTVNGMRMLLARRLVEAGVPFVSVFWMGDRSWTGRARAAAAGTRTATTSTVSRTTCCRRSTVRFAALLDDLHQRGLLGQMFLAKPDRTGSQDAEIVTRLPPRSRRRHRSRALLQDACGCAFATPLPPLHPCLEALECGCASHRRVPRAAPLPPRTPLPPSPCERPLGAHGAASLHQAMRRRSRSIRSSTVRAAAACPWQSPAGSFCRRLTLNADRLTHLAKHGIQKIHRRAAAFTLSFTLISFAFSISLAPGRIVDSREARPTPKLARV